MSLNSLLQLLNDSGPSNSSMQPCKGYILFHIVAYVEAVLMSYPLVLTNFFSYVLPIF